MQRVFVPRAQAEDFAGDLAKEAEGLIVGDPLDAATEVLTVEADRLEDVPELASQAGYDAIRHVLRRPGSSPLMVLAVENILADVYRSSLAASEEPGELA